MLLYQTANEMCDDTGVGEIDRPERDHQPESWKYKIKNNIDPMLFCYQ